MRFGTTSVKKILFLIILSLLLGSPVFAALKPNESAPNFTLRDIAGKDFSLNDAIAHKNTEKAGGVILCFFASWCVPCRHELPLFNSLTDELKGQGITVVLVDVKEDVDTVVALLSELKINKPVVLNDLDGKVSEKYQVRFMPTTFFIGTDGKIKDIIFGEIKGESEFKNSAGKLLK